MALVLTRKVGESIMIGDEVTVTLVGIQGNQAKLSFNAPNDISIFREEVLDRILADEQRKRELVR
jgi:carbon storage regulator